MKTDSLRYPICLFRADLAKAISIGLPRLFLSGPGVTKKYQSITDPVGKQFVYNNIAELQRLLSRMVGNNNRKMINLKVLWLDRRIDGVLL